MVVGRLLSYWEGNFSGAILNFSGEDHCFNWGFMINNSRGLFFLIGLLTSRVLFINISMYTLIAGFVNAIPDLRLRS